MSNTATDIRFVADLLNLPGLRPDLQGPRDRGSTTQHGLDALDPFERVEEFTPEDERLTVPGARYFKFNARALDGLVGVITFAEAVADPATKALLRVRDAGDHGVEVFLDVDPTEAEFRPAPLGVAIVGPIDSEGTLGWWTWYVADETTLVTGTAMARGVATNCPVEALGVKIHNG